MKNHRTGSVIGTWIGRITEVKGTVVFLYRTGSVHEFRGIGESKVRVCFCIGLGGTGIVVDNKTST